MRCSQKTDTWVFFFLKQLKRKKTIFFFFGACPVFWSPGTQCQYSWQGEGGALSSAGAHASMPGGGETGGRVGYGRALFSLRWWRFPFFPSSSTSGADSNRSRVPHSLIPKAPVPFSPRFGFHSSSTPSFLCICVCVLVVIESMAVGTVPATAQPSAMPSAASAISPHHLQPPGAFTQLSAPPSPQSLISY